MTRSFGQKLVKRLRIKKNWIGQKEKPKRDHARRLRGIYFIDPDDREYSEILKNARRKLERPMSPVMPCERHTSIVKTTMKRVFKTMYDCTVESHESTRQRAESLQSKYHEDHVAGKGFTSVTQDNVVHKFIPMPHATTIPDAKTAVDKEWKKLETIPAWDLDKSRARSRLFWKHKETKRKSSLLH